jgi:hypothetical protein
MGVLEVHRLFTQLPNMVILSKIIIYAFSVRPILGVDLRGKL